MNTGRRVLLGALILIAIVMSYVFLHRGEPRSALIPNATTSTIKMFALTVQGGNVVSGSGDITVREGDTVSLTVTNDADNELHLHGYNLMTDLKAGEPATITFVANASGRFPFELEQTKQDIGAISVMPR